MDLFQPSLFFVFVYLFIVPVVSQFILQFVLPRSHMRKGMIFHPSGPLHYMAWWFSFVRLSWGNQKENLGILCALALLSLSLATVPLFSGPDLFYGRPSLGFLLSYFFCRWLWTLTMNYHDRKTVYSAKKDYALTSTMILLVVFAALSFAKENQPLFATNVTGLLLAKPFCFLLFLTLFLVSDRFFIPADQGHGIDHYQLPHAVSKAVWFFILPWIFVGAVSVSFFWNFLFYTLIAIGLQTLFESGWRFVPSMSSKLKQQLDERFLLPSVTLLSALIFMEALYF